MSQILILTDISGLPEVRGELEAVGSLVDGYDLATKEVQDFLDTVDYVFTNPNKASVNLDQSTLGSARNLKAICTASTGLTHIDQAYCQAKSIRVLSLRDEKDFLRSLPSTAELAIALSLMGLRNLPRAIRAVESANWDYRPLIGSQFRGQTVGVVGLGRLGSIYAHSASALGARVLYFDPNVEDLKYEKIESLDLLVELCRIVSIHAHAEEGAPPILGRDALKRAREDLVLVNTSRGEVVDELSILEFLDRNPRSQYLADVLANESDFKDNVLFKESLVSPQITLTPHIGGMTLEGQSRAYLLAAKKLTAFIKSSD